MWRGDHTLGTPASPELLSHSGLRQPLPVLDIRCGWEALAMGRETGRGGTSKKLTPAPAPPARPAPLRVRPASLAKPWNTPVACDARGHEVGVGSRRPQRAQASPQCLPAKQILPLRFGSSILFSKLCCCSFLKSKQSSSPKHIAKRKDLGLFPMDLVKNNVRPLQAAFMTRFYLSIKYQAEEQAKRTPRRFCGKEVAESSGSLGGLPSECPPRSASCEAFSRLFKGHGVDLRTAACRRRGVFQRRPRPEGSLKRCDCSC